MIFGKKHKFCEFVLSVDNALTYPVGGRLCSADEKMARCTKEGLSGYGSFINFMDDPNFVVVCRKVLFNSLFYVRTIMYRSFFYCIAHNHFLLLQSKTDGNIREIRGTTTA